MGAHSDPTPRPRFAEPEDDSWRDDAACQHADPDLFFPDDGDHVAAAQAVAVCRGCPVINACLSDALDTRERFGIRGGLTAKQRRALLTARHRTAEHRANHRPTTHATRDDRNDAIRADRFELVPLRTTSTAAGITR
jgi:WhiB family redox-sensing transcriptional regulator